MKKIAIYYEPSTRQKCCHHWLIESAAGPVSKGVCRYCGMQNEFNNYFSEYLKVNKEQ